MISTETLEVVELAVMISSRSMRVEPDNGATSRPETVTTSVSPFTETVSSISLRAATPVFVILLSPSTVLPEKVKLSILIEAIETPCLGSLEW